MSSLLNNLDFLCSRHSTITSLSLLLYPKPKYDRALLLSAYRIQLYILPLLHYRVIYYGLSDKWKHKYCFQLRFVHCNQAIHSKLSTQNTKLEFCKKRCSLDIKFLYSTDTIYTKKKHFTHNFILLKQLRAEYPCTHHKSRSYFF